MEIGSLLVFKKIVLTVFIGFMVFALGLGYVFVNLKSNSVYYAQQTPHKKGMEPVLMEVVRDLTWASIPGLKGIEYDFDGSNIIHNYNSAGKDYAFSYYLDETYVYYDGGGDLAYNFNKDFKLVSVWNMKIADYSPDPVDTSAIIRDIFRVVQPVVDAQPEPLFNLQWVYDWVNKERFN